MKPLNKYLVNRHIKTKDMYKTTLFDTSKINKFEDLKYLSAFKIIPKSGSAGMGIADNVRAEYGSTVVDAIVFIDSNDVYANFTHLPILNSDKIEFNPDEDTVEIQLLAQAYQYVQSHDIKDEAKLIGHVENDQIKFIK